jgi:ATP-binding cassette subfamily B protein
MPDLARHRALPGERAPGETLNWRVIKRVLDYTRPYRAHRNIVTLLTVVRAIQKPAMAWAVAAIINGPITHGNFRSVIAETAGFLGLATCTGVIFGVRQRMSLTLGEAIVHDLRNDVFARLQEMPVGYFHQTKLGRILSRMITDVESVRRGVQQIFFFSLLQFGQMVGATALMIYYDWKLFALLLAIGPLVWLVNSYFHPRLTRFSRAAAESSSRMTGVLAESVRGIRVIQGFTRQDRGEEIYSGHIDAVARDNVALASESALYLPLLDLNSQLFLASLLLVGGYGAIRGIHGMEIGSLIAFFFLPNLFFQSLQQLGNLYTQAITSMAGAERVFQMLDLKPDWQDAENVGDLPDPRGGQHAGGADAGARIEFDRVSFGYDPGRLVLHEISFVAEPGQTVALVGHTGGGKTSIVNLIAKFYLRTEGEIRIDGREIAAVSSRSLRRQLGIVLQTNFLFTGSVMENIRFSRPEAADRQVVEAVRRLDCLDLLQGLPDGLETQVGEGGANLSLGQRQIVCFARAFLADPRILILDEATSAIDAITEVRLQRALRQLLAGRTSFVIAHRLSTIRGADQILVVSHGRIVERGTHAELLAREGVYWRLAANSAWSSGLESDPELIAEKLPSP